MFARAIRRLLMKILLSDPLKTAETFTRADALAAGAAVLRLLSSGRDGISNASTVGWKVPSSVYREVTPTIHLRR
jgi:hypothetical protein